MTHEELSLALNGITLNLVRNSADNKVEIKKYEQPQFELKKLRVPTYKPSEETKKILMQINQANR